MKTFYVSLVLPLLILVHLLVAPYTKVEESPAIQATHDVLVYGIPLPAFHGPSPGASSSHVTAPDRLRASYDHFRFPGAVPRSFVGPVLLAGLARPALDLGAVRFEHAQTLVRAVLGLSNGAALMLFARAVERTWGRGVARWWIALMAGQFHVLFYASRTLGNMFAFGLTTVAFGLLLPQSAAARPQASRRRLALSILTFATVIFRAELALLLGTTGLYLLATRRADLRQLALPVGVSALAALSVSVPVDSYLWLGPVWPEMWAFYYNAVLGRASDWGVETWHYYFTSALPRLLLNPVAWAGMVPLAAWLPATRSGARDLLVPGLLFVAVYSLQPHKETRFVLYVVPPLTAAAALGANYVFARRTRSPLFATASLLLIASVLASAAAGLGMLLLSSLNYPGGDALSQLYRVIAANPTTGSRRAVQVHADVLSCMTGVTLFGQNPTGAPVAVGAAGPAVTGDLVVFDKTENKDVLAGPAFWERFDYVLAEDPASVPGSWDVVGVVHGYAGAEVLRPGSDGGGQEKERVLGKGALVRAVRDRLRPVMGGWWVGPRMVPRIRILKQRRMVRMVEG